jgi:predicted dehydrogenase
MGRRHLLGMKKLRDIGRLRFDLAGVCDLLPANAERAVGLADDLLGMRPRVFAGLDEMRHSLAQIDAILITTSPDTHAAIGVAALEAVRRRHTRMKSRISDE